MPRVSQKHLDIRRQQILDAARRCFSRDGFHATSMQDVLAEANLSAGGVYRYFPSKDAIVLAISAEALAAVTATLARMLDADPLPPLPDVIAGVLTELEQREETQDLPRVIVQVWAETLRSPALAERFAETVSEVRAAFNQLVTHYQDRGVLGGGVPPEHITAVLMGLLPGFLIQRALLGDVDATHFRDGLRAIMGDAHARSAAPR